MWIIAVRVILMLTIFILIGLMCGTWKHFSTLPESNKYKSVLACDILVLIGLIVYISIKIICR
jgi:hypothetical protein